MQTNELILAEEFCTHHQIAVSFINSLHDFGLIEVTSVNEARYIPFSQLQKLEQMVRLHYELDINLEGIDVITNLLNKINEMQAEIIFLRNRLSLYEGR